MSPAPLTTIRNDYHNNIKNSSINTPLGVCQFIYDLINNETDFSFGNVFDTSVGIGNLLKPFYKSKFGYGYSTFGIDIHDYNNRNCCHNFLRANYLDWDGKFDYGDITKCVGLIIQNPPFNNMYCMNLYLKSIKKGKSLLAELFLDKTWKLFGNKIPCICFVPMGFRLNQRVYTKGKNSNKKGKRYRKMRDNYPDITSIISLPLDIFPGVEFHNEILIFNIPNLKPHYYLPEKYIGW